MILLIVNGVKMNSKWNMWKHLKPKYMEAKNAYEYTGKVWGNTQPLFLKNNVKYV